MPVMADKDLDFLNKRIERLSARTAMLRRNRVLAYNVIDHGFKADNETGLNGSDNMPAFRDLIDRIINKLSAVSNTSAAIFFPPGGFGFDTSNGSALIPQGWAPAIRIYGSGRGGVRTQNDLRPQRFTRLRRIDGNAPLIELDPSIPTGNDPSLFPHLELAHMTLDGGKDFGLTQCDALLLGAGAVEPRLYFVKFQSNDGAGFGFGGAQNGDFFMVRVHNCGSDWVDPAGAWAGKLDRTPASAVSSFAIVGGTNTLRMGHMEFEANLGPDFVAWSDDGGAAPDKIIASTWKMEGFGDGADYPYLHLRYAQACEFVNLTIASHRPGPSILHEGAQGGVSNMPLVVNHFTNLHIHQQVGIPDYMIEQTGGVMHVAQGSFSAQPGLLPTGAYWRVGPSVVPDGMYFQGTWDDDVDLVFNG